MEGSQLIHAVFIDILFIRRRYYSKKKYTRIWAGATSFSSYDHFTDFFTYYKALSENSDNGIATLNFAYI